MRQDAQDPAATNAYRDSFHNRQSLVVRERQAAFYLTSGEP